MEKIKFSSVVITSIIVALIVTYIANIANKPTEEEIEEYSIFSDELVSSLNSNTIPIFDNGDIEYRIDVDLNETESSSVVKVTIGENGPFKQKVHIAYPAKITNEKFNIGLEYKVVKVYAFSFIQNAMIILISTLINFSLIVSTIIISFKKKSNWFFSG